jgi:hypothetical protein
MPDSALNRRSEALGGWKANNASFGHQIIPRTEISNEHKTTTILPIPIYLRLRIATSIATPIVSSPSAPSLEN